ncbi:MAG: hypothetical protein WCI79_02990 [Candidatus Saccharibacteria bacterium]
MTKTSNKIRSKITIGAVAVAVLNLVATLPTMALSAIETGVLAARADNQPDTLFGLNGVFTIISSTLLFAIGAISVLMIIVGGIRYVISGGKEASVNKAKNTVLYAIIGLVVAVLAYAAINFVLTTLMPGMNGSSGGTNV